MRTYDMIPYTEHSIIVDYLITNRGQLPEFYSLCHNFDCQ